MEKNREAWAKRCANGVDTGLFPSFDFFIGALVKFNVYFMQYSPLTLCILAFQQPKKT